MSDMLEQAIVDAESLKEAALKNAEALIIEKYSNQIKEAVEDLLEQPGDELGDLGGDEGLEDMGLEGEETAEETPEIQAAHPEGGDKLCPCPEQEVSIDLSQLAEELGEDIEPEEMIDRETELAPAVTEEEEEDDFELSEEFLSSILEKLTVDVKNVPSGQPGGGSNETLDRDNEDIALASDDVESGRKRKAAPMLDLDDVVVEEDEEDEEKEELKESVKNLEKEKKLLSEKNEKYKNMLLQLKDKLEETNLSNAKYLYANRVLVNTSLNERQKTKIVEALSSADSVEEAKVIYETLQSAVGSERKRTPKSLSEAIQRSSATLSRKEAKVDEPVTDRWKILAGIQTK